VALTVTCTLCGSQQISLSPSAAALGDGAHAVLTGSVLPVQKTTPVIAPFRAPNETLASRKPPVETSRVLDSRSREFGRVLPACEAVLLSCQSLAGETTRGPPLMDPPRFC